MITTESDRSSANKMLILLISHIFLPIQHGCHSHTPTHYNSSVGAEYVFSFLHLMLAAFSYLPYTWNMLPWHQWKGLGLPVVTFCSDTTWAFLTLGFSVSLYIYYRYVSLIHPETETTGGAESKLESMIFTKQFLKDHVWGKMMDKLGCVYWGNLMALDRKQNHSLHQLFIFSFVSALYCFFSCTAASKLFSLFVIDVLYMHPIYGRQSSQPVGHLCLCEICSSVWCRHTYVCVSESMDVCKHRWFCSHSPGFYGSSELNQSSVSKPVVRHLERIPHVTA